MTFEKIGLNTKNEERDNETDSATNNIEVSGTLKQQEQTENNESAEGAELLISAERDMLEDLFQEKIMDSIKQESENYEEEHKIEEPTEDANIDSEEQQRENIESTGISSLINKIPTKARRFINAMTMASIIVGSISVSMVPSTAEAAGSNYSYKEQVDDYRKAYREERQRINRVDTARHKAKQATAKARTKQSVERYNSRKIENRHIKNDITREARLSARGYETNTERPSKVVSGFLLQMLRGDSQNNQ